MDKKRYESLVVEIIDFDEQDIITQSGEKDEETVSE